MVELARTGSSAEPTALIVLVGSIGSGVGVAVATLPDTAAGEAEAETVALAILQTLMIVEGTYRPWDRASA